MSYTVFDFLKLIGSLGMFLYGMIIMSESLQKVAGSKMRSILSAMTSNRFLGFLTGFLITSIIQSSSATTVMVVSFVNAGLLSLTQSIGIIMGANVGTTITGWIVSLFGFKVQISNYALPIIAFALPLIFSKRQTRRSYGEFLMGFALLFMGLDSLKNHVPNIGQNPEILNFLQNYTNMGYISALLFLMIGTVLTLIIQSSSATMALTIVMCNQGWLPFELGAAMILGENIGTTITANIAAIVGNVSSKRAARAHFVFNMLGVVWMMLIFPKFTGMIQYFVADGAKLTPEETPFALAMFHTFFNIANVTLLIWFVPLIVRIVEKMVPLKHEDEEEFRLKYIKGGIMGTPEISILQSKKELQFFSKHTVKMFGFFKSLIKETNEKRFTELFAKIQKYESISDNVEIEITNYLSQLSQHRMSEIGRYKVREMLKISGDLESVADCVFNLARSVNKMYDKRIKFNDDAMGKLELMFSLVDDALEIMNKNLLMEETEIQMEPVYECETKINNYRDHLKTSHFENLENNVYSYEAGILFNDIFCECEKIGDYTINVSEALDKVKALSNKQ